MAAPEQTASPAANRVADDEEVRAGDRLVEEHADFVYRVALKLTGDRDEAADLSQDAFVRILRGAGSFRGAASERTWVCRVVINCHRNRSRWWRRLKRGPARSLEEPIGGRDEPDGLTLGDTIADPSPGADRLAEGNESVRRLETALARLPADQRTALLLREVEEMSYAEIAGALGIAEGTVKSRLARAREMLRATLGDPSPAARGESS